MYRDISVQIADLRISVRIADFRNRLLYIYHVTGTSPDSPSIWRGSLFMCLDLLDLVFCRNVIYCLNLFMFNKLQIQFGNNELTTTFEGKDFSSQIIFDFGKLFHSRFPVLARPACCWLV